MEFVREVLCLFKSFLGAYRRAYRPDLLKVLEERAHRNDTTLTASPDKQESKSLIRTEVEVVTNSPIFEKASSVRGYHHDKLNEIYAGLTLYAKEGR